MPVKKVVTNLGLFRNYVSIFSNLTRPNVFRLLTIFEAEDGLTWVCSKLTYSYILFVTLSLQSFM